MLILQTKARITSAKFKHKLAGINLIGLIVASGLGVFILGAIVKISLVISDNMQLIKGINELEFSARALEQFFTKVVAVNGSGCQGNNCINRFFTSASGDIKFQLWLSGSVSDAITCSGQGVNSLSPVNLTIFMKRPVSNSTGYITCLDSIGTPTGWASSTEGESYMPLVSKAKIANFYMALTYIDTGSSPNTLSEVIVGNSPSLSLKNPFSLNIAIILKSTSPVFNKNRVQSFSIFGDPAGFTNASAANSNAGDAYLYKLVLIQVPFKYTLTTGTKVNIN